MRLEPPVRRERTNRLLQSFPTRPAALHTAIATVALMVIVIAIGKAIEIVINGNSSSKSNSNSNTESNMLVGMVSLLDPTP